MSQSKLFNILVVPISLLILLFLKGATSEEECTCGTLKVPKSYKGAIFDYRTVLCGYTINKMNNNKKCQDNTFYVAQYEQFNSTLFCYRVGACESKEKCKEDKVEKNEIPGPDALAARCKHPLGVAWSSNSCRCPDSVVKKSELGSWDWRSANITADAFEVEPGKSLSKSIKIPNGFHSTQICGSDLNAKNKNFACAKNTIYECKMWNGTNPYNKPKGLVIDRFLECEKKCISDPGSRQKRKCST